MLRAKSVMTNHFKRLWIYFKKFWKILAVLIIIVASVIALKIIPFMIIDFTPPPVTVAAEVAIEEVWNQEIPSIGTLEAIQAVPIAPEVGGRITTIHFQAGQEVKVGDRLLQLNDESEQADLKRYNAQLTYARTTLHRSQKLLKKSFASQADLDEKTAIELQNEAQVLQAKAVIEKKNIRAPFDGILGIRHVNVGQYLQPGSTVVTLTNAKRLFVNFTRPEQDQSIIALGQKVIVKVDAFPNKEFEAVITTIDPQISTETRTIKIQATMDNDQLLLAPGMFANLKVVLPAKTKAVIVPETSLDFSLYGHSIYVATEKGKDKKGNPKTVVKRHYVTIGDRQQGKVAILQGIKAGDLVVTTGHLKIDEGSHIIVDLSAQLTPPQHLTSY